MSDVVITKQDKAKLGALPALRGNPSALSAVMDVITEIATQRSRELAAETLRGMASTRVLWTGMDLQDFADEIEKGKPVP
jgi:hypothetical protein